MSAVPGAATIWLVGLIVLLVTVLVSPIFVLATQGVSRRGRRALTAAIVVGAALFGVVIYLIDPRMAGRGGHVFQLLVAPLATGWLLCWLLMEALGLRRRNRVDAPAPDS